MIFVSFKFRFARGRKDECGRFISWGDSPNLVYYDGIIDVFVGVFVR